MVYQDRGRSVKMATIREGESGAVVENKANGEKLGSDIVEDRQGRNDVSSKIDDHGKKEGKRKIVDKVKIKRALVSVSDKTSLEGLGKFLMEQGVEIVSTGGTYKKLVEAGIEVTEVSSYTGFPEMMNGRVKTLHPKIHGGLLGVRDNEEHVRSMEEGGVLPIDLLVVNLYPFEETVAAGKSFDECVDQIDVGGPSMIRGAAKNFKFVTVVTDVKQYAELLSEMSENEGSTSLAMRQKLAAHAFAKLASYDSAVAARFSKQDNVVYPERLTLSGTLKQMLRYGENPHQTAAFFSLSKTGDDRPGIATAEQVQGKELSFNNISDTDAAYELVSEFVDEPVCAIIKHANPCGVAVGVTPQDAYLRALSCDPVSAFGGIVALNRTVDKHVAEEITKLFTEVVIAPDASSEALDLLSRKKNLRVLLTGKMPDPEAHGSVIKTVSGGLLVQSRDSKSISEEHLKVVTKRQPTPEELKDLLFAWKVCKHVKSNAIVYVRQCATVGTGAGQMSRVDASRIAAWKAKEASNSAQEDESRCVGSVVASDAFFPFADGLISAADAGATAAIQPGGSKRDNEVIEAADERDMAMIMTAIRHFKH